MTERIKNKGGRGRKSENPYERFTVSLEGDKKTFLDSLARSRNLSRSEMLSEIIGEYVAQHNLKTIHTALENSPKEKSVKVVPVEPKTVHTGKSETRILDLIKQGATVRTNTTSGIPRFQLVLDGQIVPRVQHQTLKRMMESGQIPIPSATPGPFMVICSTQ